MSKINDEINTDPKKASILIVDDEAANVLLLEKLLKTAGYSNVISTQDPVQSVILYQQHNSDLILLDLDMPESLLGRHQTNGSTTSLCLSKRELCDKIKEYLPDFHIFESEIAKDPDKRNYIVSNYKIEATGWKPEFNLDMGIQELIKAYSFLQVNPFSNI